MADKAGKGAGRQPDFLAFDEAEAMTIVRPYVVREVTDPAEWSGLIWPLRRRIARAAVKRAVLGFRDAQFTRSEAQVVDRYSGKWVDRGLAVAAPQGAEMPVTWGARRLILNSVGVRRLYVARLIRLIERLEPRTVVDVGCGNGEKLLLLACRFPHIQFHGVELTPGGVASARAVQSHSRLPDELAAMSPVPLTDLGAHRSIIFHQASAKAMPFEDGGIDLVYTSLALEQMESIRGEVLAEIARICGRHASFFEAFRDFNHGGLQRLYIYAENYFRAGLSDLRRAGFREVLCFGDLPQKPWMNNVHVLASK
ncbi:MAG: class I SAM-dependent methyltransferase [Vicinamibacterales bacterium]